MTVTEINRVGLELPATPPFDFAHSLRFVRGFPAMVGEQLTEGDVLTSAVRERGTLAAVRLRAAGGAGVHCELESAQPLTDDVVAALADRLSSYLGLRDDLTEFYALSAGDEPFRQVVSRLYGYHQVSFPSPLELLVWAILGQRVPMPVARTMKHALMAACGNEMVVDGQPLRAFPDLEQLLAMDAQRLQGIIGNARKAGYIAAAVRQWAELDEGFLRTGDYDEVRERLLQITGVGPWSATFLLIRGLGRMERIAPDKEALRAASRVYGRPVTEAEFTELAGRYGAWQGYWGHYLRFAG
ncbi:DNA-3-methyladenine glycosylase 2 family protein [Modestobacter sp. I12A-02628]|uniref:DNA-3-methyladenine glycosylase II n=1 Tax=Goekera deserti TaxID=2497753 RepID=A0A7K3WFR0_9ACTN|nr:DNA-3-methyladenine glycosylase [Goekera deserti]MPQ97186.1 DNA-3-methyladenine glycosylase 2 family protein [Goekera deserti]NDI46496.1 DNA-3-methyladenine glycosylase 2 family protein [Goekera deserti]NEL54570.1 DNA-3-methyladenine glycosylase 2 family protein [Goekera deserti]